MRGHRLNDTHLSVAADGVGTKFFIHLEFFRRVEPLQCEWTVRSSSAISPRPGSLRIQSSTSRYRAGRVCCMHRQLIPVTNALDLRTAHATLRSRERWPCLAREA